MEIRYVDPYSPSWRNPDDRRLGHGHGAWRKGAIRCASASLRRRTSPCIAKKSTSASSVVMSRWPPARVARKIPQPDAERRVYVDPLLPVFFAACRATRLTGARPRSDARAAEGAPLLREYRVKSLIEGSNPSHSAILEKAAFERLFLFARWNFLRRTIGFSPAQAPAADRSARRTNSSPNADAAPSLARSRPPRQSLVPVAHARRL